MSTFNSNIHGQSTQRKSSLPQSGIAGDNDSGFLNARRVRCDLSTRFAGLFAAVKEYFWPTQTDVTVPALTGRAIDVESARECAADQCHPEQGNRYGSTIKCVVLAAATAGIAATAWRVCSTLCADGNEVKPNGVTLTPDALSTALSTTALIGRRLLFVPAVTNAIANQSVYANDPFNLQVDLSQVFSWSGSLADIRCLQANGTPLPDWLRMSITPVLVGSIVTSYAQGVTVVGNYAYVADGSSGLKIIDVSNKTGPILVGSTATGKRGYAQDVTVVGNYAYVSDQAGGLKIIDVSNKASPILIRSAVTSNARGVSVVGNYAYVADFTGGLKIIDVSNKTSPVLVGSAATQQAWGITVVGNYAYVADATGGLKIIDVTNTANPTLVGSTAMAGYAYGVTVVGNYAYVADATGLKIIDITNKASAVLTGSVATQFASGVTVVGNYAYVADGIGGLKIIDVSNKASPILVGNTTHQAAWDVAVLGNYAYVTDYYGGLKIFSSDKTLLSGIPLPLNRGILPIKLTITDTLGETATAYFWITVFNNPPIAPNITSQTVHRAFNWTIPSFSDRDGDALTYSATLADGSPLPGWVSFNSTARILSGVVPPVVTVRKINIQADDFYGGITSATQTISVVNAAPIAGSSALPNQNIKPRVPFNFSLDSDIFTDPDGDPLTYSFALANQQPLPNWLIFNQTSEMFTGTAPAGSTGSMSVIVTVADPFGETAVRSFDLKVADSNTNNNLPQKVQNPPDYSVGVNQEISFQISNNTFFDADNDPLTYTASMAGGNSLPPWLYFTSDARLFYGTAPGTPQLLSINIQAEDWQHIPASANFNLLVEGAPQVISPLSNLVANVGITFKFIVPESTFQNSGIQDVMTWSAALTTGAELPAWLTFDPATRIFTGTPTRKDTNAFSSRPLSIRLTAGNNIGATSVDFIINVQGESDATLAIKIVSSIGATLAIAGAAYAKRNAVWKKGMKCTYQLPAEYVVIGQESEFCRRITRLNPDKVASVTLLRDGQSLPGGVVRPDWLIYDTGSANLNIDETKLKEQEGLVSSRWTVQVKNKGGYVNGLVWEEFDIKFVKQLPDANVDGESRDIPGGIAMRSPMSRRDQLHQPLIGVP